MYCSVTRFQDLRSAAAADERWSIRNRLLKKWAAVCMLVIVSLIATPSKAFAACPFVGCNAYWDCLDMCSVNHWYCYHGCSGYEEPYRSVRSASVDWAYFSTA